MNSIDLFKKINDLIDVARMPLKRSTAYVVGDVAHTFALPSNLYLECIQAGTTSFYQLNLSTTVGVELTDGTVKWIVRDMNGIHSKVDGIASGLAEVEAKVENKANRDLDNLTSTGKSTIVNSCLPDYSAGVDVKSYVGSSNQFTVPKDGVIYAGCRYGNDYIYLYINNQQIAYASGNRGGDVHHTITLFVHKGDKYYCTGDPNINISTYFPFEGAQ